MNKILLIIVLFFSSYAITFAQCNVVKGGGFNSAAEAAANWSLQTAITGWHYTSDSFNGQAYIYRDGIDGTLVAPVSLSQTINGLIGNSLTVSFKIRGQNASRRNCNTSAALSLRIGGVTYLTVDNIINNTQIFESNITVANGATLLPSSGFPITVGAATAGASESILTQGTITITIPWSSGTSANLEFLATSSNSLVGTGVCLGVAGGDDWFLDDISVVPSAPIAFAMTNSNICFGNTATISLSGSQIGVNYELRRGGTLVQTLPGTGSVLNFTNQTTAGTYTIVGVLSGTTTCTTTMTGSVIINPILNASVSIAASPAGAICYGTSVTFTATPTSGGTAPVYQWQLNGINVGTNAPTYTNSTLVNNDVVRCIMTSNATPCLTGSPATSNIITVATAGPVTTPVVICAGASSVSLTSSNSCTATTPVVITSFPTVANNGSGNIWTNPNNIWTNNNSNAAVVLNSNTNSATISGTGYDFSTIPDNATITNVEVVIGRAASNITSIRDLTLNLIVDGISGGNNLANTTTTWGTTELAISYSLSPSSWGYPNLTAAQIKNSNFGVAFSVRNINLSARTASVDYISISITYTLSGINWYTSATSTTIVESGTTTFNPINDPQVIAQGDIYSSLTNTNTPGTYTFYAACSSTSTCRTPVTYVINPAPIAPIAGTVAQPDCVTPNGTFTITNYNASNTYTFSPSTGVTRTDAIVTAPPATYTITASNGICSVPSTVTTVVNAVETTSSTDGVNWTSPPTLTKTGTITAPSTAVITIPVDTDLCSCTVSAGTNVSVASKITLRLQDKLVVNGSLIFQNNASLVQINDVAANSGNISYRRYTSLVKRYDFTYWSTPVTNLTTPQTLYNLSPLTLGDKYYSFTPTGSWKIEYNGAATMLLGHGYAVRAPQTFAINATAIDSAPIFFGEPNNGVKTVNLPANAIDLLGNPYPSALSADAFLIENQSKLEGTLYFWTHNSPPSDAISGVGGAVIGDGFYDYTTNDYASYNRSGGTATAKPAVTDSDPTDPNNNNNLNAPTGYIAAGQGFFAQASTTGGNLLFNNSMRVVGGGNTATNNNSQFFKVSTTTKENTNASIIEKNRIWLNLTNKQGAFKQALVAYVTGATNEYEGAFDGTTFDGNEYIDFYSVNKGANLSIQGRALPFEKKDSVALGYRSIFKGDFQISIDHADGALTTQNVFLEDKDLKILHDLKKAPYSFNSEIGTFDTRFVLRYVDKNAVGVITNPEIPKDINATVLVSVKNGKIIINSSSELIDRVVIYDIGGRKRYQKNKVAANSLEIDRLNSSKQVLVVTILLSNDTKINRKILY